jgi:hypothetical protein
MAEIVTFKAGHPLVGTWRHPDKDYGSGVQFTIRAAGNAFEVEAVDTHDGESLAISNVKWDGQVLRFDSLTPSTAHHVSYAIEVTAPSEILIRYTLSERWVRK